jgi:hypothetical protein
LRPKLERRGAVVARAVLHEERNTSELARWDQLFVEPVVGGGLGDLLVAGVRAAVVTPEDEMHTWFSWRTPASLIDELVEDGRLVRPEPGWISAAETLSPRG